jgi:hypothetical protein
MTATTSVATFADLLALLFEGPDAYLKLVTPGSSRTPSTGSAAPWTARGNGCASTAGASGPTPWSTSSPSVARACASRRSGGRRRRRGARPGQ